MGQIRHDQKTRNYPPLFWLKMFLVILLIGSLICTILLYPTSYNEESHPFLTAVSKIDQGTQTGAQYVSSSLAPPLLVAGPKRKTWDNWPAIAYEKVGVPLVTKGQSFYHNAHDLYFQKDANGKTLMDEFLEVYKNRPDPVNMCGIRINHAMALFLAVKQIQPTLVVESGVNAGVSTYFIRAASPTTKIFAIDPLEVPICNQGDRWIDSSRLTTNYTGKKFVDLMDLDWKGMVAKGEIDPDSTLVFIDDHLHAFKRIAGVMKFGVRHIVVEDNYKYGEGVSNQYCGTVLCVAYFYLVSLHTPSINETHAMHNDAF